LFRNGDLTIGPIPQGFPISLLANAGLLGADLPTAGERSDRRKQLIALLRELKADLKSGKDIFANPKLIDGLVDMSKCPDFVVNKGHYFGTNLQPGETPLG